MNKLLLVLCAFAVLLAPPASATEKEPASLEALAQLAGEAEQDGDLAALDKRVGQVLAHPRFDQLEPRLRYAFHITSARLAIDQRDLPRAYRPLRLATASEHADYEAWRLRAAVENDLEWRDAALGSLLTLFQRWPEEVASWDDRFLSQAIFNADSDSQARHALLEALFEADYSRPTGTPDDLWMELALSHLARGQDEAARKVLARLGDPSYLVKAMADRRFDAVLPESLTVDALLPLARRRVADLRAAAILEPLRLEIQAELASAMLVAGEHEDAVALAAEVREVISEAVTQGAEVPYPDAAEYLPWLYNRAAAAQVRLGRGDEGLALYRLAARPEVAPEDTVSHPLNLAHHLITAGQPREALSVVSAMRHMSPYGRMVLVSVQYRAALATGDEEGAEAAMRYLSANRKDNEGAYVEARLEAGETDEAAAALIARLEDPEERGGALYELQGFRAGAFLGDKDPNAGQDALLAREDVQAAVARHGRMLDLPIWIPW